MIFPIGDDNIKGGVRPTFTYLIIVINVLVYFGFTMGLSKEAEEIFFGNYAANPCEIVKGEGLLTLLSSMFLHGGIMHLLGNMLFLWIFGDNIETTIGHLRFVVFYIGGGIVAALAHTWLDYDPQCIPMVGASGAISAIIGAYWLMFPKSRIKMIFILIPRPFYIPAYLFIVFWLVQQFTGLLGSPDGVAYWAHIGGLAFGVVCGFIFRWKYPKIIYTYEGRQRVDYHTVKKYPRYYNNRFINSGRF